MSQAQPPVWMQFVPFVVIFLTFYFIFLRPQSKRAKKHEIFLKDLRRGDEVVTNSGIFGRIDALEEQVVVLEVAKGIKMRVLRKQISGSAADVTRQPSAGEIEVKN